MTQRSARATPCGLLPLCCEHTELDSRAVRRSRRTARVIRSGTMAESERAKQLRQYDERLDELRRYL
jgi:hypothetical protein